MENTSELVSIIIPFYKNWSELTGRRLIELYTHIQEPCEIVLVNDASSEDVESFVAYWQKMVKNRHKIVYVKNKENRGFGYSMNRGSRVATGDTLVFLSNDVEVKSNFMDEVNFIIKTSTDVLIGGELLSHDTGWNKFGSTVVPYLNGWFLACRRYVWEMLGGFDPRYGKFDFEDVDLSYTASMRYIGLIPLQHSKLRHIGGRSFGYTEERKAITIQNRKIFADKWGLDA